MAQHLYKAIILHTFVVQVRRVCELGFGDKKASGLGSQVWEIQVQR